MILQLFRHMSMRLASTHRQLLCCASSSGTTAQSAPRRRRRATTASRQQSGQHPSPNTLGSSDDYGPNNVTSVHGSNSNSSSASEPGTTGSVVTSGPAYWPQSDPFSADATTSSRKSRSSTKGSKAGKTSSRSCKGRASETLAPDPAKPTAAAGGRAGLHPDSKGPRDALNSSSSNGSSSSSNGVVFAPEPDVPGADAVKAWVVFSDLHVSSKTLTTAVRVLRRVHEEARSRQAGVLFLGDFWDRRGDLPVVPLNTIQQEMASWGDTPLLMLPGNHDQVDLGGIHHALHPVAVAAQAAHVFTEPTLYKGSLWLPYRRDEQVVRDAIDTALQQGPLRAIFGHADVLTAHMNASYQARDGLPPGLFPERVPVYLGHYHFPHVVPSSHITYIGSPYQVSASEAGQQKRLLLLDPQWQQLGSIPISLGRKYFSLTTPAAAGNAAMAAAAGAMPQGEASTGADDSGSASDQDPSAAAAAPDGSGGALQLDVEVLQGLLQEGALQPGDLVQVKAEQDDSDEAALWQVIQTLAQQGVQVQVHRAPALQAAARIHAAEQLSMSQLLEVYADNTGLSQQVLMTAREALKELGAQSSASPQHSHLELQEVTVEGFGPFAEPISYPLADRGVVAVTGLNRDDVAAVSNGAGKTSLLTSLLWAFKAPDGRKMTNADYVNDSSRTARVTVTGRVNSEPFELTRTASKTKSSLQLVVSGVDLTQQEQRLTEDELEARFSASLLPRTLVFTQEDLLGLLQSNDAAFKKMLSAVVDMECWEAAKDAAAAHSRGLLQQQDRASGIMQALQSSVVRTEQELQLQQQRDEAWQAERQQMQAVLEQELEEGSQTAGEYVVKVQQGRQDCEAIIHDLTSLQQKLQVAVDDAAARAQSAAASAAAAVHDASNPQPGHDMQADDSQQQQLELPEFDFAAAQVELQPLLDAEQAAQQRLLQQQRGMQELRGQLTAAGARRKRYEKLQVGRSDGSGTAAAGGGGTQHICEQCLQPINVQLYERNLDSMAADEGQLQQQLAAAAEIQQQLEDGLSAATLQRQQLQQQHEQQRQAVAAEREALMRQQAAENARRAAAAEQQRKQLQQQQQRQQVLLTEIWQEKDQLARHHQQLQSLILGLQQAHSRATQALQQAPNSLSTQHQLSSAAGTTPAHTDADAVEAVFQRLTLQSRGQWPGMATQDMFVPLSTRAVGALVLKESADKLLGVLQAVATSQSRLHQLQGVVSPYSGVVQQLQRQYETQQQELTEQEQLQARLADQVRVWRGVEAAFSRTGIPSFLLEGVLGELQASASRHLAQLASGMTLELSATSSKRRPAPAPRSKPSMASSSSSSESVSELGTAAGGSEASSDSEAGGMGSTAKARRKAAGAAAAVKEEIAKVVRVQGAQGALMERSISQLSGGEKKRVALALGLGFAEVVAARGRLTSNVLILDEVLEKLDEEGCTRVAWLLKGLPYDSVFVVGQAGSFVTKEFASVDTVIKAGGRSFVELGGSGPVQQG